MKCNRVACLAFVIAAAFAHGDAAQLTSGTPVERVVTLLKDLKEKLTSDEKVEQQSYDKYACWCEKTTDRKASAITDAQEELRALGQRILTLKGRVATLASEIEELSAGIAANLKAQADATALREKQNGAFVEETAEMKQAILALQQAITVLVDGTITPAAFLQESAKATAVVRDVLGSLPSHMALKPDQLAKFNSFLEDGSSAKFSPQSFTIQGILTDMYSTFASDLETATLDEANANRDFEDFIATKVAELKHMEAEKRKREQEKAEKEAQLADTQQIFDDTTAQKEADIKFFDATRSACLSKHDEWTTRSSLREEEIAGITQALDILTSDSGRELFASAIKEGKETGMDESYDTGRDIGMSSFLQVDSFASPAAHAYAMIKKQASATGSLRLAALAVKARLAKVGHFDQVVQAIDVMIKTLQEEDLADIAKRDQCKDEYQKIESRVKNLTWLIEKNVAKIDRLEKLIKLRTEEKIKTEQAMLELNDTMQEMTATRTAENTAFLNSKQEDQDAIDLLMSARDALMSYYKNHSIAMGPIQGSVKGLALVQQPEFEISADQAPDAVFSDKGKRKTETKDAVSILSMIIEDLNDEIKNSMQAEEATQLEYEKQMAAAEQLMADLDAKKVSLENAIAQRGEEKTAEEAAKEVNVQDLDAENSYKKSITDDCDFIIRTFEKRAKARTLEMQGLVGAKDYLAGAMKADSGAFLQSRQRSSAFDDTALSKSTFLGIRN